MGTQNQEHKHHILSTKVAFAVFGSLLVLTFITVWIAGIDLGRFNFTIAMAVATVKALLVALFFMGLKYDHKENSVIFASSFVFLAIFLVLTGTDLFFRGPVYTSGAVAADEKEKGSKYEKPWESTDELIAKGKELFAQQCVSCHGPGGAGDGPAAAALNPPPRNFLKAEDWFQGRTPAAVFAVLKKGGRGGMASYATLPVDDRWALTHYVLSLGPQPVPKSTAKHFEYAEVDPTKPGGGGEFVAPEIAVDIAMELMAEPEMEVVGVARMDPSAIEEHELSKLPSGERVYKQHCVSCHGEKGSGGIQVTRLGAYPSAYVTTMPLKSGSGYLRSEQQFTNLVIRGLAGQYMPGNGQLSSVELSNLYDYVRRIAN